MQRNIKLQDQQQPSSKGLKGVRPLGGSKKPETQQFHKTKLLLSIYRTVVWRIETAIYEVQETAQEYGSDRISELVDFLSSELDEYDLTKDKKAIEERLMCIAETKQMIEIVDKALKHLKTHPKHGQVYWIYVNTLDRNISFLLSTATIDNPNINGIGNHPKARNSKQANFMSSERQLCHLFIDLSMASPVGVASYTLWLKI
jgi:hypothetical protein